MENIYIYIYNAPLNSNLFRSTKTYSPQQKTIPPWIWNRRPQKDISHLKQALISGASS